jgi:hypothetical protein
MEKCQLHDDISRRLADAETRLDTIDAAINTLQISAAAKDEQVKTIFIILAEIKQMLKDYTADMKYSINRLATDIENIKGRPGKFADGMLTTLLAAVIGAVVMFYFRR